MVQTEGLLFKGDSSKFEHIFQWALENNIADIQWIAEWLPLYSKNINSGSLWHPYALKFIDHFGKNKKILSTISANIGTFSSSGTLVGRYERMKLMFEELLDHKFSEVREWAASQVSYTTEQIEKEKNNDLELSL